MRTLNLGILAHVDAGKTTLTERLLYAAGVIDALGSVDAGTTQTDTLALERQRGITIKAAVVAFVVGDVTVNLIDTPGHPDFIAEVERSLSVLDGAVLVISAVEGVQAQTRVLMRALQRLRLPTLLFVNKIDRIGADPERVLRTIAELLTPAVVAMGSAPDAGTRAADFTAFDAGAASFTARVQELLAEHNDALLAAFMEGRHVPYRRLRAELAAQCRRALVHPVFFGSAITGAGVQALMRGITSLLPPSNSDAEGPLSGRVFKVERGEAGDKVAYARLFSGMVRSRERVRFGEGGEAKVTALSVFERGGAVPSRVAIGGQIAKLWGLADVRIGDVLGESRISEAASFPPPTLEAVVVPRRTADRGALYVALSRLAEQDPLINLRHDDRRDETSVSLYGEVQKEVIQATLAADFGLQVEFCDTTTICIERPCGTGAAVELMRAPGNPFLATVGLRVEPGQPGSGVRFSVATEVHGMMPFAFFKAVEDTVYEASREAVYGWQLLDCLVTMTHAGYAPKHSRGHNPFDKSMSSTGADFRGLTPLVLMQALQRADTDVCEPLHHFTIAAPAGTLGALLPALAKLGAVAQTSAIRGRECVVEGEIAAAHLHELQQALPVASRGEGVIETTFARYEPVRGTPPSRPRTNLNPLNRTEYLSRLSQRFEFRGAERRERQAHATE